MGAVPASTAARAACMKPDADDQVAAGRLRHTRIVDEGYGRTEDAYILDLAAPACLAGTDYDDVKSTMTIHVYSMDPGLRKKLKQLTGRQVTVRGSAFGEQTAHHHAPIVMDISDISPR
jgi:hypothetical protein